MAAPNPYDPLLDYLPGPPETGGGPSTMGIPPATATPTPRATPTTPTTPANPWGTAPSNGNWQQWWTQNVGTNAPSLAYLQGLESQLQPVGVKLNRNASNAINGKITLPSGQVVDVVRAFGTQDPNQMAWQWDTGTGGGGTVPAGSLTAPFTEPFNRPPPLNLGGPTGMEWMPPAPQFHNPTFADLQQDPSYQWRLQQGEHALEQSAAARGVLNTGGTLKDVLNYGQSAGSQEFANMWGRNFDLYNAARQNWQTTGQAAQRASELDYDRSYSKWLSDYNIYRNQQNDVFDKQYRTTTG